MFPPMHLDAEFDEDGTVRKPGQDYYLKPMNCPMHNLIFRCARPVLPRTAAAAVRVRHRLPLREVRRRPRPDPRARHDPGRRAHLLHPRADARRADQPAAVRARPARATTGSTTSTWSCPPRTRTSTSAATTLWEEATATLARGRPRRPGWSWCPTRAEPRSTARRSPCRRRTRSAAPGRCRRSSSTSTCPSGSSSSTPAADGTQAAAGDDPPCAVRLDRAVLRRAHRALRGRVPGLAVAGAGGRHPGRRRAFGDHLGTSPRSCGRAGVRAEVDTPTTGCRRRSAPTPPTRCRSCCSRASRTSRRALSASASATAPRSTACPSARRSSDRRLDRAPRQHLADGANCSRCHQ